MAKNPSSDGPKKEHRYGGILAHIFAAHYAPGSKSFEFERTEIETAAKTLKILLPKNLGDLIYSFRFSRSR